MVNKLLLTLALLTAACNHVPNPETAAHRYMEYTPVNVAGSVYKLEARGADGVVFGSGTGWKVAEDLLVTAGHVCEGVGEVGGRLVAVPGVGMGQYSVTIDRLVNKDGLDLCLLLAPGIPGASLARLDEPEYGEEICYTGAPLGIWGAGLVPHACGPYQGANYVAFTAERGASGSPIYTKDGVVGVLVSMVQGFPMFRFVPAAQLKDFLAGK